MECPISEADVRNSAWQGDQLNSHTGKEGMPSQNGFLCPEMLQNLSLGGMPAQQMMMPMMPVQQFQNMGWDRQISGSSVGSEDLSLGGMHGQQNMCMMPVSQMPQQMSWDRQMSGSSVGSEISFVWVPVQVDVQNQPMLGQGVMPGVQSQDRQDQVHMVSVPNNSKLGQMPQLPQSCQFQQQMQPRQQQQQSKIQEMSIPDNGDMNSTFQQLSLLQQQQEMRHEDLQLQEKRQTRNKTKSDGPNNIPLQSQIDQIEQLQRRMLKEQQRSQQSPLNMQQVQGQNSHSQQGPKQQSVPQMNNTQFEKMVQQNFQDSSQGQPGQQCMPMFGSMNYQEQMQGQGGMAMMMKGAASWQGSPDAHPSAHYANMDQAFGKGGPMDEMTNQKKPGVQQMHQQGQGYYASGLPDELCMDPNLLYSSSQQNSGNKQEGRSQGLSYQQQLAQLQQQIMQMESELINNNGRGRGPGPLPNGLGPLAMNGTGPAGMAAQPKQGDGALRNPRGGNKPMPAQANFSSGFDNEEMLALRRAAVAAAQPTWPERRMKREKQVTKVSPHYSLPTSHGALVAADTMKSQLQALQLEEPSTIFIARRINKLGFASAELLRLYFQKFGPVKGVYVSHSRVKSLRSVGGGRPQDTCWRLRAAGLGFVVMQTTEATSRILAEGPRHMVNGVSVQVHTFSRRSCSGEDTEQNDADEDAQSNDEGFENGSSDNQESGSPFTQSLDVSAFKHYSEQELIGAMPEQYED